MLIYLCDDSESDLLRLKHYLNKYAEQLKLNFELFSFSSGEELLAAFQQADTKPELIFLDIFMEKLSGMEAARQLRSRNYQGGIIFTTSSTEHAVSSSSDASRHGNETRNVLPFPSALSTVSVPPIASVNCFTIASPRPIPSLPPVLLPRSIFSYIIFFL